MTTPMPEETKCPNMNSPQSQAEAMAEQIFRTHISFPKDKGLWPMCYVSLLDGFSTALSKLIAENDGLKFRLKVAVSNADEFQSQLTATEAKLSECKKWMRHAKHCPFTRMPSGKILIPCDCGLDAFLSTLTAEKKEEAK